MNGLRRTAILTVVSLLFLVTQAYAYSVTFGGVTAKQNGLDAGLTSAMSGIDNSTNTAVPGSFTFIETFDLPGGGGGFNTLNATKLEGSLGNYGFSNVSIGGVAAAPFDDETYFFYTPKQGGLENPFTTIKVPNTAFFAYQPNLYIDYLGLYFGSIDTYNALEFYFSNGRTETITGTYILSQYYGGLGTQYSGSWTDPASNVYVNLHFNLPSEVFTAFALKTSNVALEIDNFVARVVPVAPVPEPSTVILIGTGLLGLAALGRKRSEQ